MKLHDNKKADKTTVAIVNCKNKFINQFVYLWLNHMNVIINLG